MTEPSRPLPASAHLVGVGGAGMSGIARILLARGCAVSGSDAKPSRALDDLRTLGAVVHVGHDASHVEAPDLVIASTAIREDNPELVASRARGIPVLPRAAALALVMQGQRGVAVAGTHGKTTTTSMLTVALQHCGADPSFAIGGDLNESGSNARFGTGEAFVAEADESDGSFLMLSPEVAVVTNVEVDHLDHYSGEEAIAQAFLEFASALPVDGFLVTCADDPGARRLAGQVRALGRDVRTYGTSPEADLRIDSLLVAGSGSSYEAVLRGRRLGPVTVGVPGAHNALNSAAVLLTGIGLGWPAADLREGISGYTGVRRRFELKGEEAGVRVVDDYAHHPTEIRVTVAAARSVVGAGRLLVAFQPHRYSRTEAFAAELGEALGLADEVVVMDVYAAGEDPVPGVSGANVAAAVPLPAGSVWFEPSWTAVAPELAKRAKPGDLVMTLGAGDVTQLGAEVLLELQALRQ